MFALTFVHQSAMTHLRDADRTPTLVRQARLAALEHSKATQPPRVNKPAPQPRSSSADPSEESEVPAFERCPGRAMTAGEGCVSVTIVNSKFCIQGGKCTSIKQAKSCEICQSPCWSLAGACILFILCVRCLTALI
jgi:hypothetical protein